MKGYTKEAVQDLILQIRSKIEDVIEKNPKFDNNFYLYRWLIHYHMKVERAERAIRESLEWKQAQNIDILADQEWGFGTGLENVISLDIGSVSKKGQPVIMMKGESLDLRGTIQKYGKENVRRLFFQWHAKLEKTMLEHYKDGCGANVDILDNGLDCLHGKNKLDFESKVSPAFTRKSGKSQCQTLYNPLWYDAAVVLMCSFKNFSMLSAAYMEGLSVFAECAKAGFNYFPCSVSAVYVLNLNKFSNIFVNFMKPLLTSQPFTLEFHDTNKEKWSKILVEQIDEEQLLHTFGGIKDEKRNTCYT